MQFRYDSLSTRLVARSTHSIVPELNALNYWKLFQFRRVMRVNALEGDIVHIDRAGAEKLCEFGELGTK